MGKIDYNALRYSQTKCLSSSTRRYSENYDKNFGKGKPEECDLTPVEGNEKGVMTHLGKHRWGHNNDSPMHQKTHEKRVW